MKWHQEYQEYSKALKKFMEYKKGIDERMEALRQEIQTKEKELDTLLDKQVTEFMEGDTLTDDKKVKELKLEIEYLKEKLERVGQALKEDKTIQELAQNVFTEYKELMEVAKQHYQKETEELERLEKEYQEKEQKLLTDRQKRINTLADNYISPRLEILDYIELPKVDRVIMQNRARGL